MGSRNQRRAVVVLSLAAVVIVGTVLTNFAIRGLINSRYYRTINNEEVINAFRSGNKNLITQATSQYQLRYQQIDNGQIVSSSGAKLPRHEIVSVPANTGNQVLGDDSDLILKVQPYKTWIGNRLYFILPMLDTSEQTSGYLVYIPVFP